MAGAVVLSHPIAGLADSKKLSKLQREKLAADIKISAQAYGLGWVDAAAVDSSGTTNAVKQAMAQALEGCIAMLGQSPDEIIIDGHINYLPNIAGTLALIKADATVPAVSAASILAKVARDDYMAAMALQHPGYGFEKHVGYGTAVHQRALEHLGLCPLHRRSFKPIAAISGANQ